MNGCRAVDGERSKILRRLNFGTTTVRRGEDSFVVSYLASRGKRHPIVFLHGLGTSKADFLPAVEERSLDEHTIVAFDFPGFGETSYPSSGRLGVLDLVDLTQAVLDALDLPDAVVVGHSMGGLVGLLLARGNGARLAGFVNVEGNLGPEDCFYTANAARCSDRESLRDDFFRPLIPRLLKSEDPGAWRYASQLRSRLDQQAFLDYSRSVVDCCRFVDLLAEFHALQIPKLYLFGANSESLPYLSALRASRIDSAELADSGHFPAYSNPRQFFASVAKFVEKTTGGARRGNGENGSQHESTRRVGAYGVDGEGALAREAGPFFPADGGLDLET